MPRLPKLIRRRGLQPLADARLIVGLGNPGAEYAGHRHNAGLRAAGHVHSLLRLSKPVRERHFRVSQAQTQFGPAAVVFPRTFMNESGRAVQSLLMLYGAEPSDLILLVDELDLAPGRIRIRPHGSDAGQRGMRSIRQTIGDLNFPRIRIGVGRPIVGGLPSRYPDDVANYLVNDPTPDQLPLLQSAERRAAEAVVHILEHGLDSAMNTYNQAST